MSNKDYVTLHYAAWNLESKEKNSLERKMVEEFMKKHTNIKIIIDEEFITNPYSEAMKKAASNGSIPDVFMYSEIPTVNENNWCMDITDIISKDSDWNNIPEAFKEASSVKGKIVSIPYGMYLYGYFYNKDLFDLEKRQYPENVYSVAQFENTVKSMTDINAGYIGLADESNIIDWYPSAANNKMGWFSWDGGKFNINSQEFIKGVNLARYFYKNKLVFSALSEPEKKNLKGANDWEAWCNGTIALKFDGTWSSQYFSSLNFKVGFTGIPGGRQCIVPDFAFISSKCKHVKEAYEFAKYMSPYSPEGFKTRIKLAKASKVQIATLPMIKDKDILKSFFSDNSIDGIEEAYNNINNSSYVEVYKILPGYEQARWNYKMGMKAGNKEDASIGDILYEVVRGELRIESLADELDSISNECIKVFPRQYIN